MLRDIKGEIKLVKRIIAVTLACVLMLTGCGKNETSSENLEVIETNIQFVDNEENILPLTQIPEEELGDNTPYTYQVNFESLGNEELQRYVRDNIYNELVVQLNSDEYFIENISTAYVSQEYIDEVTYTKK